MKPESAEHNEPEEIEASDTGDETESPAEKSVTGLANSAYGFVKTNPWKSVAIVAIVAGVIGYFLSSQDEN